MTNLFKRAMHALPWYRYLGFSFATINWVDTGDKTRFCVHFYVNRLTGCRSFHCEGGGLDLIFGYGSHAFISGQCRAWSRGFGSLAAPMDFKTEYAKGNP